MIDQFQGCSSGVIFRVGYGWNEPTSHACAIARVIHTAGVPVTFSSTIAKENGVDEYCDSAVVSSTRPPSAEWFKSQGSDVIWFDVRKQEARAVKRAGLRNTLVLLHPSWITGLASVADLYSNIVVMSSEDQQRLSKQIQTQIIPTMCYGYPPVANPYRNISVWFVDNPAIKKFGAGIVHTLSLILAYYPKLTVTFVCQGNWDGATNRLVSGARKAYLPRCTISKRLSHMQRIQNYQFCDSVVNLSCGSLTGLCSLECLDLGRPLAAFPYGLAGRVLANFPGVWHLPCDVAHSDSGISEPTINFPALIDSLKSFYALLGNDSLPGYDKQAAESYLKARREKFITSWQQLLQLQ